jgi:hypothetical protein
MRTRPTFLALVLLFTVHFAQAQEEVKTSKFSIGFGASEQFVGKDTGENFEGFVGYAVHPDITLIVSVANANMRSDAYDIKYRLDKYAFHVNYDFGKSEDTKFESIFGFSYVNFDKKALLEDNNGLGIDLGFQTTFNASKRFNYGLRLVSTYTSFSPGGILNAGINFKYNL